MGSAVSKATLTVFDGPGLFGLRTTVMGNEIVRVTPCIVKRPVARRLLPERSTRSLWNTIVGYVFVSKKSGLLR